MEKEEKMTGITSQSVWQDIQTIRLRAPLVHNITNYVVMNSTANALLCLGASPVMAHAKQEVEEMVHLASALVVNIGTLSEPWIQAMERAMRAAQEKGIPVVFDPVGAGATTYRTTTARSLISSVAPAIIRGNASEILALASDESQTKGVDSLHTTETAVQAARQLCLSYGSIVSISGVIDIIVSSDHLMKIGNGHALMGRVTGMGCTATAITGAFSAVNADPFQAAAHAMITMGIAGQMAASVAEGPGTMQLHFLDALHQIDEETISRNIQIEE